ncbi:AI-2E family transporter [Dehalobacter sp. DCM]|uniref:AI-2E family transporter n=1 Tax=Dehalobacter sp. DCM TaxID=2907827 RepID=UPI0030819048|nr:AI-2E family transporter [Dehalobacter sp. DCM]
MTNDTNKNIIKYKTPVRLIILSGVILLLVIYFTEFAGIISNIYGVIFPLLLGAAMAYVINILVCAYERIVFPKSKAKVINQSRRGICILFAIVTIILILAFFLYILIPQINLTVHLLTAGFPQMYNNLLVWANEHQNQLPILQEKLQELNMDGATVLKKAMSLIGNWAWGTVSIVGTVFGKVLNFILAFIFAIYVLFGKDALGRQFRKLLRRTMRTERREKLYAALHTANVTFTNYIVGQVKEAVILGVLCTIGMLIFGFPYATVIGPFIGLTALIPLLGGYIGALVGVLLIVMVDPFQALLFIIFILILQQIEGNLIYPKVVGDSIGLPGLWVFAAITIGGGLMGIAGVLLGVPVAATIYKLLSQAVNNPPTIKIE